MIAVAAPLSSGDRDAGDNPEARHRALGTWDIPVKSGRTQAQRFQGDLVLSIERAAEGATVTLLGSQGPGLSWFEMAIFEPGTDLVSIRLADHEFDDGVFPKVASNHTFIGPNFVPSRPAGDDRLRAEHWRLFVVRGADIRVVASVDRSYVPFDKRRRLPPLRTDFRAGDTFPPGWTGEQGAQS